MFCKKGVFKNFTKFTGKHLCQSLFFNKSLYLKRDAVTGKFCEISKNTFSHRTPPVAPSQRYIPEAVSHSCLEKIPDNL